MNKTSFEVIEVIAAVRPLPQDFVRPNNNLDAPTDTGLRFAGDTAEPAEICAALNNSFGFEGIDSAIVLTQDAYAHPFHAIEWRQTS